METTEYTMASNPHWLSGHHRNDDDGTSAQDEDNNNNNNNNSNNNANGGGGDDDDDITSALLLPDLHGKSDILKPMHIRELSNYMPARAEGYAWTLAFTTTTMGFSLKSLYRSLSRYEGPVLLIIRDGEQRVFGAFSSCTLNPSDSFYGTGETYLFTFKPAATSATQSASVSSSSAAAATAAATVAQAITTSASPAPLAATKTNTPMTVESSSSISKQNAAKTTTTIATTAAAAGAAAGSNRTQFVRYPWTGENLYFIKGNTDSLAFGAGEGKYGLWLDEDLYHGSTHSCKTFNNEPLTSQEDFVVCTLECWCFL